MVAIVGGEGLGLFNTSLNQLNGYGAGGSNRLGTGNDRAYLNAATGNLILQSQDDYLAALGLDVAAMRTYNSRGLLSDDNADNWQMSLYRRLLDLPVGSATTPITREGGDGHRATFIYNSGTWVGFDGVTRTGYWISSDGSGSHDILYKKSATEWVYEDTSNGISESYDAVGRITAQKNRDGQALTYAYSGSSNLITQITDASGKTTFLEYAGTQLVQVSTVGSGGNINTAQVRVRYGYDTAGRLNKVTVDLTNVNDKILDSSTYVTNYEYFENTKLVSRITQTDGSELRIGYVLVGTDYRVGSLQQLSAGTQYRSTFIDYDVVNRRTTVTDPMGQVTSYVFDDKNRLTEVVTPQTNTGVRAVTAYGYDAQNNITDVTTTTASGQTLKVVNKYDIRGNLTETRDKDGNTVRKTYNAADQVLTETVYLTPAADNFAVGEPATPQVTRYVYDSEQHLRFVISPDGRVTENVYFDNAHARNGLLRSTIRYSGAGSAWHYTGALFSEADLAMWVLNLGIGRKQAERIDYSYDAIGQLNTSTRYLNLDDAGVGVASGQQVTTFSYDRAGRLLSTIQHSPQGTDPLITSGTVTTVYTYDGLGRVLTTAVSSTQEPTVRQTVNQYDDALNRIITTVDKVDTTHRLLTTSLFNKAGDLISVAQVSGNVAGILNPGTALGTTEFKYDANGRQIMSTDPQLGRTHYVYDERGRLVGVVNPEGELTETVYNEANQVVRTIRYSGRITADSLVDSSGNPYRFSMAQLRGTPAGQPTLNERPRIDLNGAQAGVDHALTSDGATPVSIVAATATATDSASATWVSLTVKILNPRQGTAELLSASSLPSGLEQIYDASQNLLTIRGTSSQPRAVSLFQTALQSLKLQINATLKINGTRQIQIVADDGSEKSIVATTRVTLINQAPILDLNSGTAGTGHTVNVNENNQINLALNPVITDNDSSDLYGASISIRNVLEQGLEVLLVNTSLAQSYGITVSSNTNAGTMTFSGQSSVANYRALLATLQYRNYADAPSTQQRHIDITVNDGYASGPTAVASVTVTPVDDAIIDLNGNTAGSGNSVTMTENDPPVSLTLNPVITDHDGTDIYGATISIREVLEQGLEVLLVNTTLAQTYGIQVSSNTNAGTMTFSGQSSIANYRALFATLQYGNYSENPSSQQRFVDVTLHDGYVNGPTASVSITIAAVDDAVLDLNGNTAGTGHSVVINENDPATNLTINPIITDPDGTELWGATISIRNVLEPGLEILLVNTTLAQQYGIEVSSNTNAGTMTFSGRSLTSNYQALLATLQYRNYSEAPSAQQRFIDVAVNDGFVTGPTATVSVTVNPLDDAPILDFNAQTDGVDHITRLGYNTNEVLIGGAVNIIEPDGEMISGAVASIPGFAVLSERLALDGINLPITGSLINVTYSNGVMTFTGSASAADYKNILDKLMYVRTALGTAMLTNRSVEVTITSGSKSASSVITVLRRDRDLPAPVGNPEAPPAPTSSSTPPGPPVEPRTPPNPISPSTPPGAPVVLPPPRTPSSSSTPPGTPVVPPTAPAPELAAFLGYPPTGASTEQPLASVTTGASIIGTTNRVTDYLYDIGGRLVYTVVSDTAADTNDVESTQRSVTEIRYDGAGRKIGEIAYAARMPTSVGITLDLVKTELQNAAYVGDKRESRMFYSGDGLLVGMIDGEGYLTEYTYDAAGRQFSTTRYSTLAANGSTLAQVRPASTGTDLVTRNFYNARGDVSGTIDAEGYFTQYTYNVAGTRTEERRFGKAVTYSSTKTVSDYATEGNSASGLKAWIKSYSYDTLGRVVQEDESTLTGSTQTPLSNTTYEYNAKTGFLDRMTRGADQTSTPTERRSTTFEYDALGRVKREAGGEGSEVLRTASGSARTTAWGAYGNQYDYDSAGRRIKTTEPNGKVSYYYYDKHGRLRYTVTTASLATEGEVTELQYNAFGEVSSSTRYSTRILMSGLSGGGNLSQVTDKLPTQDNAKRTTSFEYTLRGQLRRTTDALNTVTRQIYNAFGQVERQISQLLIADPLITRKDLQTYDRRGLQKTSTIDAGGLQIGASQTYDAFGRVIEKTDAQGRLWKTSYDRLGRVVTTTDSLNKGTVTAYDAFGRVLSQTDKLGKVTSYAYNMATAGRRIVTVTTPEGVITTSTYDSHGSQIRIEVPNGTVTEVGEWSYDRDGRLKTRTVDATGLNLISSNDYNKAGQLIGTIDQGGIRTSYTYDAAGRTLIRTLDPTSYALPDGTSGSKSGALNLRTQYAYDAFGSVVKTTDPEDVVTETIFDRNGYVKAVVVDTVTRSNKPGPLKIATVYSYDASGRVLTLKEGVQATGDSGSLDVSGSSQRVTDYLYDKAGRRVQQRVAGSLVIQYEYDKNGNLILNSDPADGVAWRSFYDEMNRKVFSVDRELGVTEMFYDAEGRVIREVRYAAALGFTPTSATTTTQVRAALVANAQADRSVRYVYDADGRVAFRIDALGQVTGMLYDKVGRVVKTTVYATAINVATLPAVPQKADIVMVASASDRRTFSVYDSAGRERFQVDGSGGVVESIFDNMGRRIESVRYVDELNLASLPATLSLSHVTPDVGDGVRREYSIYDAAGRLSYSVGEQRELTQYVYDKIGNVIKKTAFFAPLTQGVVMTKAGVDGAIGAMPDASRNMTTRYLYDGAGREIYELRTRTENLPSYTVLVRQKQYTLLGDVSSTTAYSSRDVTLTVDAPTAAAVQSALNTRLDAARDNRTTYLYDSAGRLAFQVDSLRAVTAMSYDSVGRLLKTRQLATVLNPNDVLDTATVTARVNALANDGSDRINVNVYDAAGRLLYQVDPTRSVTAFLTDKLGNVTRINRDPQPLSSWAQADRASLDTLVGGTMDVSNDRNTWSVYDLLGRKLYDIDALGYVNAYARDRFDNVIEVRQYSAAIATSSLGNAPSKAQLEALLPSITPLWSQDFATGAGGLTLSPPTGFVQASGGRLSVISPANSSASGTAVGQLMSPVSGYSLNFRSELNTGSTLSGRRASIGLDNGLSGENYRSVAIYFHDGLVYAAIGRGQQTQQILLGSVNINKNMMVEVELGATGATVYLYNQGESRETGLVHSANLVWTGQARVRISSQGSGTAAASTFTLDNASFGVDIGRRTRSYYDAEGRQVYQIDALGYATKNFYDSLGQLTETTKYGVPLDLTRLTSSLTPAGIDAMVQVSSGRRTLYVYDAAGQLRYTLRVGATQAGGVQAFISEQKYDGLGLVAETVGYDKAFFVDEVSLERISELIDLGANPELDRHKIEIRTYDRLGRLSSLTDAENKTEFYTYDGLGNLKTLVNKMAASSTDAAYTWTYDYDAMGRRKEEVAPRESYGYGAGAKLGHKTTLMQYNVFGEMELLAEGVKDTLSSTFSESRRTVYYYDQRGIQQRVLPPGGVYYRPDTEDHSGGATTSATTASNFNIQTWTDAFGQAIANSNQEGRFSYKIYDALGRVTHEVDEERYVTAYTYDAFGNALTLTRHGSRIDSATLDSHESAVLANVPNSSSQRGALLLVYGIVSVRARALSTTDARTITTTYDDLDRKTSVKQAEVDFYVANSGARGRGRPTTEFAYDAYGQQVRERVLRGVDGDWLNTHYAYDSLGRQMRKIDAMGHVTVLQHDAFDRLVEVYEYALPMASFDPLQQAAGTAPFPMTSYAAIDSSGVVAFLPTQGVDRHLRIAYDRLDREIGRTRIGAVTDEVVGDVPRRVVRDLVESWRTYDAVGNVTASADSQGNVTHTYYDKLGQITRVAEPTRSSLNSGIKVDFGVWQVSVTSVSYARPNYFGPYRDFVVNYPPLLAWGAGDVRVSVAWNYAGGAGADTTIVKTLSAMEGMASATLRTLTSVGSAVVVKRTKIEKQINGVWTTISDSAGNPSPAYVSVTGLPSAVSTISVSYSLDTLISGTLNFYKAGNHFLSQLSTYDPLPLIYDYVLTARNASGQTVDLRSVGGNADGTLTGDLTLLNYSMIGNMPSFAYISPDSTQLTPVTSFAYDILGQEIASTKHGKGGTFVGNSITTTADANDQVTLKTYDRGLLKTVVDAMGKTENFEYDRMGRMTKQYRLQSMVADTAGNTLPLESAEIYEYDRLGNITGTKRVERQMYDGSFARTVGDSSEYNAFGEVVYNRQDSAVEGFTFTDYDNAGRAWQSNAGNGVTKISEFDLAGNMSSVGDLQGVYSASGYSSRRLTSLGDQRALDTRREFQRDDLGRLIGTREFGAPLEFDALSSLKSSLDIRQVQFDSKKVGFFNYHEHELRLTQLPASVPSPRSVEIDYKDQAGVIRTKLLTSATSIYLLNGTLVASWRSTISGSVDDQVLTFVRARVYSGSTMVYQTESSPQAVIKLNPTPGLTLGNELRYREQNGGAWRVSPLQAVAGGGFSSELPTADGSYLYEYTVSKPATFASGATAQQTQIVRGSFTIINGAVNYFSDINEAYAVGKVDQSLDRWGNVIGISDVRDSSWITRYRYNYRNQIAEEILPAAVTYDALGNNLGSVTAKTSIYYDSESRQIAAVDDRGSVTRWVYDAGGRLVSEIDANGVSVRRSYDALGREISYRAAIGSETVKEYDKLDRLIRQETLGLAVRQYSTYEYDELGNRIKESNALNETKRYQYDSLGRLRKEFSPLAVSLNDADVSTTYRYDLQGRVTSVTRGDSAEATSNYDYFGRLLGQGTLNGVHRSYSYDSFGRLSWINGNTENGYLSTRYSYTVNGWLKLYTSIGQSEVYKYDLKGNRITETRSFSAVGEGDPEYNETLNVQFDSRNRIVSTENNWFTQTTGYDSVGNRIFISTTHKPDTNSIFENSSTNPVNKTFWYSYDKMNRIVVAQGKRENVNIPDNPATPENEAYSGWKIHATTEQGSELAYDSAGNRVQDRFYDKDVSAWKVTTNIYDKAGQLIGTYAFNNGVTPTMIFNPGYLVSAREYDAAGRVIRYFEMGSNGEKLKLQRHSVYNANGWLLQERVMEDGENPYAVFYADNANDPNVALTNTNQLGWYHKDGNIDKYGTQGTGIPRKTYHYEYQLGDAKKLTAIVLKNENNVETGRSTMAYNSAGHMVHMKDQFNSRPERFYVVNADGQVLRRIDKKTNGSKAIGQHYLISSGQLLASAGLIADDIFDYNYQPISDSFPSNTPSQYVARDGDTLQGIALSVYGDASLWYLIADANGVATDAEIIEGMTLTIPNRVTNLHNNKDTFQPYNASDSIGSLTPTAKPPKRRCGTFAKIIQAVVTVVVSSFAGPVAGAAAGNFVGQVTLLAANGELDFGKFVAWSFVNPWLAAEKASDGKFSSTSLVTDIAIAAVTVGISEGLTAIGKGLNWDWLIPATKTAANGATTTTISTGRAVVQGALGSVAGQATANALAGRHMHFSWGQVLGSALASGLSQGKTTEPVRDYFASVSNPFLKFGGNLLATATYGFVSQRVANRHGKIDMENILVDAFGNALGNSIGGAMKQGGERSKLSSEERDYYDRAIDSGLSHDDAMKIGLGAPGFMRDLKNDPARRDALLSTGLAPAGTVVSDDEIVTETNYNDRGWTEHSRTPVENSAPTRGRMTYDDGTLQAYAVDDWGDGIVSESVVAASTAPSGLEGIFNFTDMLTYVPGPIPPARINAGPATFMLNGALNTINAAPNIALNALGALGSVLEPYQGEITNLEVTLGSSLRHQVPAAAGYAAAAATNMMFSASRAIRTATNANRLQIEEAAILVSEGAPSRLVFQPSSGVVLEATPGKTTTILGNYGQDMKHVVNELGNVKSTDFGPRPGGFNVLNVPDDLYRSPGQFWHDYNQPWLGNAVSRGDPILMATEPQFGPGSKLFRLNDATGKLELSGFGKEYLYLRQNGYRYNQGIQQMVPSP